MNPKILAAALVGVLAVGGGGVAAGKHADKRLQAFYENKDANNQPIDPQLRVTLKSFDMGAFSGTAAWQGDYIFDMCAPEQTITLRAEDHIRRGFGGYHITSKVYLVQPEGQDIFLFDAETQTAWGGDIDSKLTVPAGEYTHEGIHMTWEAARADISLKQNGSQRILERWNLDVPAVNVEVPDNGFRFALNTLKVKADIPMHPAAMRSGKDTWTVDKMTLRSSGQDYILEQLNAETEQQVNGETVAFTSRFDIAAIRSGDHTLDKIRLHAAAPKLNKEVLAAIYALNERYNKTCLDPKEAEAELEKIALQAATGGLIIESKDNHIGLNGSSITAEARAEMSAGSHADLHALQQALAEQLQYQARVEIDKEFVRQAAAAFSGITSSHISTEEQDMWIQQIIQLTGGVDKGDKIVITRQK
ncbi:uncharacterized protein YdgA (DUF945 family) [Neisseria sp. HSC-16F19]|nr:DUF945 family protein [Neisseria sp. HSC-16F19]MCP2039512.1 uncharacterized protein YdgA (DUF945 family) [Neisseria sp. HSC-16F19]